MPTTLLDATPMASKPTCEAGFCWLRQQVWSGSMVAGDELVAVLGDDADGGGGDEDEDFGAGVGSADANRGATQTGFRRKALRDRVRVESASLMSVGVLYPTSPSGRMLGCGARRSGPGTARWQRDRR